MLQFKKRYILGKNIEMLFFKTIHELHLLQNRAQPFFKIKAGGAGKIAGKNKGIVLKMHKPINRDFKLVSYLLHLFQRNWLFSSYTAIGAVIAYFQQIRKLI